MRFIELTCLVLSTVGLSNSIIGFDCSGKGINITTIATDYVPGCSLDVTQIEPTEEIIQLVQIADQYPLHVYQCKVRVLRSVTHCGMHHHASEVRGGLTDYLRRISASECIDAHRHRSIKINHIILDDLQANSTVTRAVVMAGDVSSDGKCKGGFYSDTYGSWSDVVVQGTITIGLSDFTASADTSSDTIILRSGLTCKTSLGECMDVEHGFTTWTADPLTKCDRRKHMVLYEGRSNVYTAEHRDGGKSKTYIVEGPRKVFGLRIISAYDGCMFKAYTTEHPKLIIIPKTSQNFYFELSPLHPSSMDLMAYVNTKFVYVEKIHHQNMRDLYIMVETQRCSIERRALQTLLSLAYINPQEFAYSYMERSGYTALRLGEVIHVIECVPVDVTIRPTKACYNELPITYNDKHYFLTPRSRLLQLYGTQVDCDDLVNAQYRFEDAWYAIGATRHLVPTPLEISPTPIVNWKPKSVQGLAQAGIYTYEESEKLRERVMNPYEREAINNILVRGVSGRDFERQGITLSDLVDDNMVDDLGVKIGKKLWGFFSMFGNISAGVIGIYMMTRIVKFGFDTLIHCRALYEVYGLSVALIAGVWGSLTGYLIHRHHKHEEVVDKQDHERIIVHHSQPEVSAPVVASAPVEPSEHHVLIMSASDTRGSENTQSSSSECGKVSVTTYPVLPKHWAMP